MRFLVIFLSAILVQIPATFATSQDFSGTVVAHFETCDHFVIKTPTDYVLMQWSRGTKPAREAVVTARLSRGTSLESMQVNLSSHDSEMWIEEVFPRSAIALHDIKDPCQCQ